MCVAPWIAACSGGGGNGDGNGGGQMSQATVIPIVDANNYTSTSSLNVDRVEVSTDYANTQLCWDAAPQDIQCHALSPATDIKYVMLVKVKGEPQQVAQQILEDTLPLSITFGQFTTNGTTCTSLASFGGSGFDLSMGFVEDPTFTYFFAFAEEPLGVGVRNFMFIEPKAASATKMLSASTGCGKLTFTASLTSRQTVKVPRQGPVALDYSALMTNGQGLSFDASDVSDAFLAFYPGMTAAQLEQSFFDIELLADPTSPMVLPGAMLFEGKVSGGATSIDLRSLQQRTATGPGAAFTDFGVATQPGTWLFAALCGSCKNPQPLIVAVIEPTG
ncbi:MAG: hypothetical protein DIU78_001945 [Pseudomonadota bacterium]|nr:MAG: hypothetical protein DIU78_04795 [Pseudomonadota bacterium]